jgi:hypothetical protein
MALTRSYKETVMARIQRDRKFARLMYAGALEMLLEGETAEALVCCFPSSLFGDSQTGRWGRLPPCRGEGGGAGALVAPWNRSGVFVGELEPPVPRVEHSNR